MKFFFYSLGCKVNSYEISCLKRQALCLGNEVTNDVKKADVIVINTCTVTQMSSKKSRQKIRSFRRDNSKAVLIAMGCFTEEYLNESLFDLGVDIALGNNDKETIFSLLDEYQKNQKKILCNKVPRNKQLYPIFDKYPLVTSARPYVKIQDGCDAFCTYCIIPLVRGKSRSRKPLDVIDEIKTLVENGAKEIVITHNTEVLAFDGKTLCTCPIKARNLSGRSGRGDTTFAAYITERLNAPIEDALLWATATVSAKMEHRGPYRGTRSDIQAYIDQFYR